MSSIPSKKKFLLVVHGGMVLYLMLHGLVVPLVRNIGRNEPLLTDIHFWFIFHIILFILFFKTKIGERKENWIPWFIWAGVFGGIFKAYFQLFAGDHFAIGIHQFSLFLELGSYLIFFCVFFFYFKDLYYWESTGKVRRLVSALIFSFLIHFGLSFVDNSSGYVARPKKSLVEENRVYDTAQYSKWGCEGADVKFVLPLPYIEKSELFLISCGLNKNLIHLDRKEVLKVTNKTDRATHMRLFKIHDTGKKEQLEFAILPKQSEFTFFKEESAGPGIYLLQSKARKEVGLTVVVVGENLPAGRYHITPNKVEVINE